MKRWGDRSLSAPLGSHQTCLVTPQAMAGPGACSGACSGEEVSATTHPPSPCCSQLSATFTIPIWQWFLTRFGKKTAVYVGISVSGAQRVEISGDGGVTDGNLLGDPPSCTLFQSAVPFLILVALMKSNLIVTYVVAIAAGVSVAAAFLLPW